MRLTPAGRRLADHAVTILADAEARAVTWTRQRSRWGAACRRLRHRDPPLRCRRSTSLARTHPGIEVRVRARAAREIDLLARDGVDLALTYDYDLAPAAAGDLDVTLLWEAEGPRRYRRVSRHSIGDFADRDWIVNSRHTTADEEVLRTLAPMAGVHPRKWCIIDSPGVGRRPRHRRQGVAPAPGTCIPTDGVEVRPLADPASTCARTPRRAAAAIAGRPCAPRWSASPGDRNIPPGYMFVR